VCWLALAADGKTLASASEDGTFCFRNIESGEELHRFMGAPVSLQRPLPIALASDGRTLAQALPDNTIQLWDVAAGLRRHRLQGHRQEVLALSFFHDGTRLVSGSPKQGLLYWDVDSGRITDRRESDDIKAVAASLNGRNVVWLEGDRHISWHDHFLGFWSGWDPG
jgi:WD40 repeat protein